MSYTTEGPKPLSKKARKLAELTPKAQNPFSVILPDLPNSTDYVAPVTDASGLFAIDTNPTPVDHPKLQKEKRRITEQQGDAAETRAKKRHKSDEQPPEQPEDNNRRDSFEQKVEEHLQKQEEKRERKAEKKRKRESNGSIDNSDLAKYLEPTPNPKKRRKMDMKAQLQRAKEANPDITMKDIKKLNLRKNWRRLESQGIRNIAEAHEAQKKHDAKKAIEIAKREKKEEKKRKIRIKKKLKKRAEKRAEKESGDKNDTT